MQRVQIPTCPFFSSYRLPSKWPATTTRTTPSFTTFFVKQVPFPDRLCQYTNVLPQTQGDAWFKPLSENLAAGVCLRVSEAIVPDAPTDGPTSASSRSSSTPALPGGAVSPGPFPPSAAATAAPHVVPQTRFKYRVFPYDNPTLAPFEAAVRALNPVVAVKVRSAAVHAALGSV